MNVRNGKFRLALIGAIMAGMVTSLSACETASTESSQDTQVESESTEITGQTEESDLNEIPESTEDVVEEEVFGTFEAETIQGDTISNDIFSEADLTMVNIWATYCNPCIDEMPDLGELSTEYADQGFQIVGIVSDVVEPGDEAAQTIIDSTGANYTHIVLNQALYDNYLSQVQAVPTTVFVDQNGKQVGQIYLGSKDKDAWSDIIEEYLQTVKA